MRALVIAVAAAAMVGSGVGANIASAHGKFQRAEPAPDSTVAPPKDVRVWFSVSGTEELNPRRSTISVWDSRGRQVDDGKGGADLDDMNRRTLRAKLKPLGPGVYTVKWKAVSSEDGNVAQGTFRFTVRKGDARLYRLTIVPHAIRAPAFPAGSVE